MIQEYEGVFAEMKKREVSSKDEARDVLERSSTNFNLDSIRFKNQFFKKEDYQALGHHSGASNEVETLDGIKNIEQKMLHMHEATKGKLSELKLYELGGKEGVVGRSNAHEQTRMPAMWLTYGRSKEELKAYPSGTAHMDFLTIMIIIRQNGIGAWLMARENHGKADREYFQMRMQEPAYREELFELFQNLNPREDKKESVRSPYWIKIGADKKPLQLLSSKELLFEFIRYDDWKLNPFVLGRNYSPDDPAIATERIIPTISAEFDKLARVYEHLKHRA
jgi:hypothetical protein